VSIDMQFIILIKFIIMVMIKKHKNIELWIMWWYKRINCTLYLKISLDVVLRHVQPSTVCRCAGGGIFMLFHAAVRQFLYTEINIMWMIYFKYSVQLILLYHYVIHISIFLCLLIIIIIMNFIRISNWRYMLTIWKYIFAGNTAINGKNMDPYLNH
jgi:hypothetical protein